ncbi:BSSP4 protease, partial [Crotophaga sulcirostris]|nr:BSSP4 protease [Crotophaga sulcirostris]
VAVALSQVLPHPRYAGEATSGDVALARLARAVPFSAAVLPVCLPAPGLRFPPGTRCVATGWGDIREGGEKGPRGINGVNGVNGESTGS